MCVIYISSASLLLPALSRHPRAQELEQCGSLRLKRGSRRTPGHRATHHPQWKATQGGCRWMEIPFARDGEHVSCSSSSGCEEMVLQVAVAVVPSVSVRWNGSAAASPAQAGAGTLTSFCDPVFTSKLSLSSLHLEGCAHVKTTTTRIKCRNAPAPRRSCEQVQVIHFTSLPGRHGRSDGILHTSLTGLNESEYTTVHPELVS